MVRTSELQDFNRGTICGQGGLPMAVMLGPGDHLWQPHSVRGTDYEGTIDGMTDPYLAIGISKESNQKSSQDIERVHKQLFSRRLRLRVAIEKPWSDEFMKLDGDSKRR